MSDAETTIVCSELRSREECVRSSSKKNGKMHRYGVIEACVSVTHSVCLQCIANGADMSLARRQRKVGQSLSQRKRDWYLLALNEWLLALTVGMDAYFMENIPVNNT
jgi:hypothetical protein